MRTLISAAVLTTLVSAFMLYAISYDTGRFEQKVRAQERQLETLRQDIAVLKAERAHLARPDRIAPYARGAGLAPPEQGQFAVTEARAPEPPPNGPVVDPPYQD